MITKKEVEAQFLKELNDLLRKWDAEIEIVEDWRTSPHLGITIPSKWDDDNNQIREYTDINLGTSHP